MILYLILGILMGAIMMYLYAANSPKHFMKLRAYVKETSNSVKTKMGAK